MWKHVKDKHGSVTRSKQEIEIILKEQMKLLDQFRICGDLKLLEQFIKNMEKYEEEIKNYKRGENNEFF